MSPETFRPAAEARTNRYVHAPLQPPNHLEGRFSPAERLPGGWYYQTNESGVSRADFARRGSDEPVTSDESRRSSFQSVGPASRSSRSIPVPRRVESIVDAEAITAYHNQQANQRPAGGAYYEAPRRPFVPPIVTADNELTDPEKPPTIKSKKNGKQPAAESPTSTLHSSSSSVSLHFALPPLNNREPSPPHQPRAYTPTRAPEDSQLALPRPAYHPGSSAVRNGRSPLARKSFTRLATMSPTGEVEVEVRVPRRIDEEGGESRAGRARRRSVSVDERGRRRLSKQRRGSRDGGGE